MRHQLHARTRHGLLSACALASVIASLAVGHTPGSAAPVHRKLPASAAVLPPPPTGTDLVNLDTETGQYTQAANKLTDLHLYNSPVGVPAQSGWRLRDLRLTPAGAGAVAPVGLPFGVQIATPSGTTPVASLLNESRIPLTIGVTSLDGVAPAAVTGIVGDTTVTYPSIVSATTGPAAHALVTRKDAATPVAGVPLTPTATSTITSSTPMTASPVAATATTTLTVTATSPATLTPTALAPSPTATSTSALSPTSNGAGAIDLALHPTISGLDVRLVLHNPDQAGPFVFTLSTDSLVHYDQEAGGAIRMTRPITSYSDSGELAVTEQPEYIVEPPIVADSNADPAALLQAAPASLSIATIFAGTQSLTVAVDEAWLHAPARVFPVSVDVPIATGDAAMQTGLFGSVNSCAPSMPAPLSQVVVGTEAGCAYHGEAYFNVSSIMGDTPIISATLNLYTPDQTGPSGVQVYANAPITGIPSLRDPLASLSPAARQRALAFRASHQPPYASPSLSSLPTPVPLQTVLHMMSEITPTLRSPSEWQPTPWQPWSWSSTPAIAANASGTAQSGAGHWQTWDVTSLVRQWVRDDHTNNGFALVGSGVLAVFSSPLGEGHDAPAFAPYLDIMSAPRPAISPFYNDGAPTIAGISETYFATEDTCGNNIVCSGSMNMQSVSSQLGGSYARFGVTLSCTSPTPGLGSNNTYNGFWNQYYDELANAYAYHLIPIIDFLWNHNGTQGNCPPYGPKGTLSTDQPTWWQYEIEDFFYWLKVAGGSGPNPVWFGLTVPWPLTFTYYEIGNEPNFDAEYAPNSGNSYALDFYYAAYGVTASYVFGQSNNFNYRIMNGGVLQPSAGIFCTDDTGTFNVLNFVIFPILLAEALGAIQVSGSGQPPFYALGAHPYTYVTDNLSSYWKNYIPDLSGWVYNACADIDNLITFWVGSGGFNSTLVFTEDNYNDQLSYMGTPCQMASSQYNHSDECQEAYLADLFTWLTKKGQWTLPWSSPIRVAWFRGSDIYEDSGPPGKLPDQNTLGIYNSNGTEKYYLLQNCNLPGLGGGGNQYMDVLYYEVTQPGQQCY